MSKYIKLQKLFGRDGKICTERCRVEEKQLHKQTLLTGQLSTMTNIGMRATIEMFFLIACRRKTPTLIPHTQQSSDIMNAGQSHLSFHMSLFVAWKDHQVANKKNKYIVNVPTVASIRHNQQDKADEAGRLNSLLLYKMFLKHEQSSFKLLSKWKTRKGCKPDVNLLGCLGAPFCPPSFFH